MALLILYGEQHRIENAGSQQYLIALKMALLESAARLAWRGSMTLNHTTESVDSRTIWNTLAALCRGAELLCTAASEQPSGEAALQE